MRIHPIFSSRPDQELFNRVNQRFKELTAIGLSTEKADEIKRRLEIEAVCTGLRLEGIDVSEEQVRRVAASHRPGADYSDPDKAGIAGSIEAYRMVAALVDGDGKDAELSLELLTRIAQAAGAELRKGPSTTKPDAVTAEHLPMILEVACRWFAAESFAELNPAEQSAIALLRVIELQPFERANLRLALITSGIFTMRRGLPPLIISTENAPRFSEAVEEGLKANTKPLVEVIAESLDRSLSRMIEMIKGS